MCTQGLKLTTPTLLEKLPELWRQNDVLVLLINLDSYTTLSTEHLSREEKEHLEILKTYYFKKRYIISRLALKKVIIHMVDRFEEPDLSNIILYNDGYGRVQIKNRRDLHVCISYTENIVSLSISKVKVGIDIEIKKPVLRGKISKLFLNSNLATETFKDYIGNEEGEGDTEEFDFLRIWTLKEAYCKFSNKGMLSNLAKEPDLNNSSYSTYVLNNKYILSIITDKNSHTLNISCLQKIES